MPIQEKPLKMPNQNNPQIREYIDAIERGKDVLHVLPTSDGWKIKKIGGNDFGLFGTQTEAVSRAKELLHSGTSAEVITHDRNGLISGRFSFSENVPSSDTKRNFWSWFK